jgi:hypothetical protein
MTISWNFSSLWELAASGYNCSNTIYLPGKAEILTAPISASSFQATAP